MGILRIITLDRRTWLSSSFNRKIENLLHKKGTEECAASKNREIILIAASALILEGIIRYGYDKFKENKRLKNKANAKEQINIKN